MRILHLSTHDLRGGAARAAYRLHTGLRQLGEDSRMFVLHRHSDDPSVVAFAPPRDLGNRLRRRFRRARLSAAVAPYNASRPPGLEPWSDDRSQHGAAPIAQLPEADVVTLHWVAGLVDHSAFFPAVPARRPVVWRLADQAPLTGGCHYTSGCERFTGRCGACPQLGSESEHDPSRAVWQRKQRAFAAVPPGRLHLVALSRWMAAEIGRSSLMAGLPLSIIPNGVDLEALAPRDRAFARDVLGVPAAARVLLFAADAVGNQRKGFALLAEALAGMATLPDLYLLSLGRGRPEPALAIAGRHLGPIDSYRLLSLAYSAADLFVVPSLEDNFPNTAIEALACGTPIVGFAAGGLTDVVRPETTGELVPVGDVAALRAALTALLADDSRRARLGESSRRVAVAEYGLATQARRYLELYREMVDRERVDRPTTDSHGPHPG